jgi:hypothetical protein
VLILAALDNPDVAEKSLLGEMMPLGCQSAG